MKAPTGRLTFLDLGLSYNMHYKQFLNKFNELDATTFDQSFQIPDGFGLRINCHPTTSGTLNFSLLPSNTIVLDLAKYGLNTLPRDAFMSAPNLQQIDLQNNGISSIDPKTFKNLPNLKVLDLSYNSIEIITKSMFSNLRKLERLKLNSNKIETIENGSFDDLFSLVKIELADNKLSCDCHLEW